LRALVISPDVPISVVQPRGGTIRDVSAFRNFFRPYQVSAGGIRLADILSAPYVRLAGLTAIAGTLAFSLGRVLPNTSAVTAAITAMISMRHTFHESIRESLTQVLAVMLGGTVAFIAMKLIGFNAFVIFLAIGSCFVVARLLKLGEEGALAIAVTVILVLGPTIKAERIESRFAGVVVGVVIAMGTSYFVRSGTPQERALRAGVAQSRAMAELLHQISTTLGTPALDISRAQAATWLARAEAIAEEVAQVREQADSAEAGASWSPAIDRREAAAVARQLAMTEATAETVVNICRELVLTFGKSERLPAMLASALSGILNATAAVIEEQAEVALESPAATTDDEDFDRRREAAIKDLRVLDETQPLFIGGSIIRDAEKISDILAD
jgi:uncharacterized membrane protein YgaE (UPF0421/DUF939 family)